MFGGVFCSDVEGESECLVFGEREEGRLVDHCGGEVGMGCRGVFSEVVIGLFPLWERECSEND